jgi:hypothetical protein
METKMNEIWVQLGDNSFDDEWVESLSEEDYKELFGDTERKSQAYYQTLADWDTLAFEDMIQELPSMFETQLNKIAEGQHHWVLVKSIRDFDRWTHHIAQESDSVFDKVKEHLTEGLQYGPTRIYKDDDRIWWTNQAARFDLFPVWFTLYHNGTYPTPEILENFNKEFEDRIEDEEHEGHALEDFYSTLPDGTIYGEPEEMEDLADAIDNLTDDAYWDVVARDKHNNNLGCHGRILLGESMKELIEETRKLLNQGNTNLMAYMSIEQRMDDEAMDAELGGEVTNALTLILFNMGRLVALGEVSEEKVKAFGVKFDELLKRAGYFIKEVK